MEVPNNVLASLVCENCEGYLSRGPVLMLTNGKSRCGRCVEPEEGAQRNLPYEALAKLLTFPCRYKENGCSAKVSFKKNREHENACAFRPFVCPIAESGTCEWFGGRGDLLTHCQTAHPDNIIENSHKLIHNITKSSLDNYLLSAFRMLFLVQTKVCVTSRKIYHSVRLFGDPRTVTKYKFTVEIENNGMKLIKPGNVAPQGCMALQEDSAVKTGINNVLAEMGDYRDTVFTVTVESTDSQDVQNPITQTVTGTKKKQTLTTEQQATYNSTTTAAAQSTSTSTAAAAQNPSTSTKAAQNPSTSTKTEQNPSTSTKAAQNPSTPTNTETKKKKQKKKKTAPVEVICEQCKRKTGQVYRDTQGWLCASCAPGKRICKNKAKGCTFKDINSKCDKHEMYYCAHASFCQICNKNITGKKLKTHYNVDHANIMCKVGAKFSIDTTTHNSNYFIVNTSFGHVICLCIVDYTHIYLFLTTPLPSEQLYQQRCSIAIKHPVTDRALTVLPVMKNEMSYDTIVNIQRSEFDQFVFNNKCNIQIDFL